MSNLSFVDLAGELLFTKVVWDGKVVYDDEWGSDAYDWFIERYATKKVNEMLIRVHSGHHVELRVKGEK